MAKAKKPAAPETPATEPAAEAPKPAAKKPAAKKAAAPKASAKSKAAKPAPTGTPLVDTNLAAQTAARLVGAKVAPGAPAGGEGKKETSAFKQMRDAMTKGHSTSVHSVLNNSMTQSAKNAQQPTFRGGKQVGRNQTFGSDASKNFVPRRTGG